MRLIADAQRPLKAYERDLLEALAKMEKRVVVCLNKEDWYDDTLLPWLDFWLKGLGPAPPFAGLVEYQDGAGQWRPTAAWPPPESHDEVLYFNAGKMDPAPSTSPAAFRSVPHPVGPEGFLCPSTSPPGPTAGLVFQTPVQQERVVLAGNPLAYVPITSDLPGGLVGVHVFLLRKDFACAQTGPTGARLLVAGAANLRFHGGTYQGKDFPMNARTVVRVDITNLAEVVAPGERLAFVVSHGDWTDRTGAPFAPTITLAPGSGNDAPHVVLPILEGSFGGAAPALTYPPRPFVPPVR